MRVGGVEESGVTGQESWGWGIFSEVVTDETFPVTPPLIAIEIRSPDDRLSAVREKLEDFAHGESNTFGWSTRTLAACMPAKAR